MKILGMLMLAIPIIIVWVILFAFLPVATVVITFLAFWIWAGLKLCKK